MTIKELYINLHNNFKSEELFGELTLHGNSIHWQYEIDDFESDSNYDFEDDEDFEPNFESESQEELLNDAYAADLDLIEGYLDELDELDNWKISESKISNGAILFKIN